MKFKPEQYKYFGNYRGKVMDNEDPLQRGRVRVLVHGFFDGIKTNYLPWAYPVLPLISGSGSGAGWFAVPEVGSYVMCFFEGGDVNQPVYFGEASDGVHGNPSDLLTNYPNRRGFKTSGGHMIYVDDTSGVIQVEHSTGAKFQITGSQLHMEKSGAVITIDNSGNITISGTKVDINP